MHFEQLVVGEPANAVLFLHGILGSGKNLRTLGRRFAEAVPGQLVVLADVRAHGGSTAVGATPSPVADTIEAAAGDVVDLASTLAVPVRAVVAHSLSGKVALSLPPILPSLEHLVVVDSNPGPRLTGEGTELVEQVVQLLESAVGPWDRQEDFVGELEARGLPRPIAQWLAMNLRRAPEGLRFGLDLRRIRALLVSYFSVDLWPAVERAARGQGPSIHMVIGERSPSVGPQARTRLGECAERSGSRLTVDTLPTGHWVHAEDPDGLLRILLWRLHGRR